MKKEFDLHTVIKYSLFYCQIFKCNVTNHKILQEYGKLITKVKNKLEELKNPLPKLAIIYVFLNDLDISYQIWKNIYLWDYTKDSIDKDEKIIIPIMKKIVKLLINKENEAKVSATLEFTIQTFKVFHESLKKPKNNQSLL